MVRNCGLEKKKSVSFIGGWVKKRKSVLMFIIRKIFFIVMNVVYLSINFLTFIVITHISILSRIFWLWCRSKCDSDLWMMRVELTLSFTSFKWLHTPNTKDHYSGDSNVIFHPCLEFLFVMRVCMILFTGDFIYSETNYVVVFF